MTWIDDEDRDYFNAAEERYLEWCKRNLVEPYVCLVDDCDRRLPCREHPPEIE